MDWLDMTFVFDWAIKLQLKEIFGSLILSTRYGNFWDVDIPGGGITSTI